MNSVYKHLAVGALAASSAFGSYDKSRQPEISRKRVEAVSVKYVVRGGKKRFIRIPAPANRIGDFGPEWVGLKPRALPKNEIRIIDFKFEGER
ncbi:MAG: hypothetical protein CL811_01185 [Colwelliaceae bacterium]|nr:hypothetical protein [Colwelliaceae bacterium]|tara:strand:+ start:1907 stop:2185 length:279 start_codon:yes stop_codon:yes gene_type:complete